MPNGCCVAGNALAGRLFCWRPNGLDAWGKGPWKYGFKGLLDCGWNIVGCCSSSIEAKKSMSALFVCDSAFDDDACAVGSGAGSGRLVDALVAAFPADAINRELDEPTKDMAINLTNVCFLWNLRGRFCQQAPCCYGIRFDFVQNLDHLNTLPKLQQEIPVPDLASRL